MSRFRELFPAHKPIIGMIHLPPLPDYPGSPGIDAIVAGAVADMQVLQQFEIDGVLVENEYDRPHRIKATPETVAAMTQVTRAVVENSGSVIVGCEILLNDPRASLDVAMAAGAQFIRTDYFVDRMSRPEYGEFDIDPEELLAYRDTIGAAEILLLADIQVKYATMLQQRTLAESAKLATQHRADAVVISGNASGDAPTAKDLVDAKSASGVPVIIGSGLRADNAQALLSCCDGAIVGTALMMDEHVDAEKVRQLMENVTRPRVE
jgi:membrane complex biogenesis BtpA family protein